MKKEIKITITNSDKLKEMDFTKIIDKIGKILKENGFNPDKNYTIFLRTKE